MPHVQGFRFDPTLTAAFPPSSPILVEELRVTRCTHKCGPHRNFARLLLVASTLLSILKQSDTVFRHSLARKLPCSSAAGSRGSGRSQPDRTCDGLHFCRLGTRKPAEFDGKMWARTDDAVLTGCLAQVRANGHPFIARRIRIPSTGSF